MRTEAEIRWGGMSALIEKLGLVEAERFIVSVSRDRMDHTLWRRTHLPSMPLEQLAAEANAYSVTLERPE